MRTSQARAGARAGSACHRGWSAYGKHLPSRTQGGSRMRESRTYGSVRGARDETRVPTATRARVRHLRHDRTQHREEGNMNRRRVLSISAIMMLGLTALPNSAISQQWSIKDQL